MLGAVDRDGDVAETVLVEVLPETCEDFVGVLVGDEPEVNLEQLIGRLRSFFGRFRLGGGRSGDR